MIIAGYPGVGKTRMSYQKDNCVDLESSYFDLTGSAGVMAYCNLAMDMSEAGSIVFVSTHDAVRKYLETQPRTDVFAVLYPVLALKDLWIKRLEDRYARRALEKDLRALERATNHYEEDINDLMCSTLFQIQIANKAQMDGDLSNVIRYGFRDKFLGMGIL